MLTTQQFVSDFVDQLVAQGVALSDVPGLKTTLKGKFDGWLDAPDAVPANLAYRLATAAGLFQAEVLQRYDFWNGTAAGGPHGDGTYDLAMPDGTTVPVPCLAKLVQSTAKGDPGGVGFTFSTTTADADPGAGKLRFNNAAPASVTQLFVDLTERGGSDVSAWLDSFDDADGAVRGVVQCQEVGGSKFAIFGVTGAVVDGGGYRKVPVTLLSGSALFVNNAAIVVNFARTGASDYETWRALPGNGSGTKADYINWQVAQVTANAAAVLQPIADAATAARVAAEAANTAAQAAAGGVQQDTAADPFFSVADNAGFAKATFALDGTITNGAVSLGPAVLQNSTLAIYAPATGVRFAEVDPQGYCSVFVLEGEALRDNQPLITANTSQIAANTAAITANIAAIAANTAASSAALAAANQASADVAAAVQQNPVGADPYFSVSDGQGYAAWAAKLDGGFGSGVAWVGPALIYTSEFQLSVAPAGLSFALVDSQGYCKAYAAAGESLRDNAYLEQQIAALQVQVLAGSGSAGIPSPGVRVRAHRGTAINGIALENTLDAVIASARAGYIYVEGDVHLTSDKQPVLCHDDTIDRTYNNASDYSVVTGGVNIMSTTLATLRANYVAKATNPAHRRPIPTLRDYLLTCRKTGQRPLLEFKGTNWTTADIDAVVALGEQLMGKDVVAWESFDVTQMDYVRSIRPTAELQFLYGTATNAIIDHVASKSGALFADYTTITSALVTYAHSLGVKVSVYTAPNAAFNDLVTMGVDEICTDTIAPKLNEQAVVFRDYALDGAFSAYTTTGTVNTDGTISLAAGQTITLKARSDLLVAFGAHYTNLDIKGAATVAAANLTATINEAGDDFVTYAYQCMVKSVAPSLVITGGSGGCRVKDIRLAVARF